MDYQEYNYNVCVSSKYRNNLLRMPRLLIGFYVVDLLIRWLDCVRCNQFCWYFLFCDKVRLYWYLFHSIYTLVEQTKTSKNKHKHEIRDYFTDRTYDQRRFFASWICGKEKCWWRFIHKNTVPLNMHLGKLNKATPKMSPSKNYIKLFKLRYP